MTRSLAQRDHAAVWHPATHFQDLERLPPLPVRAASGAYLIGEDGREILDAISSWWTCIHGHGHPAIKAAVRRQLDQLDHVMFAGFTHESAVGLAEGLLEAAPPGYERVFYADCGSASIEVAMKMSYQFRLQSGEPDRRRFAALRHSYHGETLGALAVCGSETWREPFGELLLDALYLPVPTPTSHGLSDLPGRLGATADETEAAVALLHAHADTLTAVLVEPIVQCAGNMNMPGSGFYRRLVTEAQSLGIHVIADEIAVGFGRTGRMFASEWSGVTPDFLCLSKGLSGGILPLAAVLVKRPIPDAFRGSPSRSFLHSHTYTGNPIACASGLASLKLFETEETLARAGALAGVMDELRAAVARTPGVVASRQAGTIAAFDLDPRLADRLPDGRLSLTLRENALARGVLLRPLHNTIYWMPPLCVNPMDLEKLADATVRSIKVVT